MKKVVCIILSLLFLPLKSFALEESKEINIPCTIKECNPEWGDTKTRFFPGDKKKPAIIWYGGGKSIWTSVTSFSYAPINLLEGKFDIILVASPIPIISDSSNKGVPLNAYNKQNTFRMKQVAEYYKKKLNKPIWLGGNSAGGPRMIGALIGDEKDRRSDIYSGLIFASAYLCTYWQGSCSWNLRESSIDYKMNLPILIIEHERDKKPQHEVRQQKYLQSSLSKRNSNVTELKVLTEGYSGTTDHDGGHHHFATNREEVARVVSKFIMDHTK